MWQQAFKNISGIKQSQHGLMKGKLCSANLDLVSDINGGIDKQEQVDVVNLDCQADK